MIETTEQRHEKLVNFLGQFKIYSDSNGQAIFPIRKTPISPYQPGNFEYNSIIKATAVLGDLFNLTGVSLGDFDLYKLLQAYFLDENKRKEINSVL